MNIIIAVLNLFFVIAVSFALWKLHERIGNGLTYTADVERAVERRLSRIVAKTSKRVDYLEWRINHPEVTFTDETSGRVLVKYNDDIVACIEKSSVWHDDTCNITGKIEFLSSMDMRINLAMELKDFAEKYADQIF